MKVFAWGVLLAVLVVPRVASAQLRSDARDYEILGFPPKALAVSTYLRNESTSGRESVTLNYAVFGTTLVLRYGRLAFSPCNFFLPVVDATAYVPSEQPGLRLATHTSGLADLLVVPAIGYDFPHGDINHTYTAFSTYLTAPTGSYRAGRPLNLGENRWSLRPSVMVGNRFLKAFTIEALSGVEFFTDNRDFFVPEQGKQTLAQKPNWALDVHLAVDLSTWVFFATSYYATVFGKRYLELSPSEGGDATVDPRRAVHTLRFTWGVRPTPKLLVLLQFNQDVGGTNDAPEYRFFGTRISFLAL